MSPQSIYISYNSQSPTISQKVLQGDNHFLKDVLVSHNKIKSVRHLLTKFSKANNLSFCSQNYVIISE